MKKFWIVIFFLCAALLLGFDWPVGKRTIIMNFCQSTGYGFRTGNVFAGTDEPVNPIADGEAVFYFEEGGMRSNVPYGLGSFCALMHEGGIQSVYGHLKKGTMNPSRIKYGKSDVIGLSGNTGSSTGNNLFLQLFDVEDRAILNPEKNISPPEKDIRPPVLGEVMLKRDNIVTGAGSIPVVPAGKYEILVSAYDPRPDAARRIELAPYKITVALNGQEISSITFQSLKEKDGELVVYRPEKTHADVYEAPTLFRTASTEFVEGKNHLQVTASDFYGNQTVKDIFFEVKR